MPRPPERPALHPETLARADELVRSVMASRHVLGLSIAVVAGGDIAWSAAYGTADLETGEPLTVGHRFSAMSVTKPLIATALMQLHERGLFALDDAANKYLEGAISNQFESESPVTIRQLLTHTSGLPVSGVLAPGSRPLADYVRLVARTVCPPGEAIVYANWGYDAIGLLVQRLSGEPLADYVQKHVLEPLAMASSNLGEPPPGGALAPGHIFSSVDERHHRVEPVEWPVQPAYPAGGLHSTAEDLARFLIAHLTGGGSVLRPQTAAQMQRLQAADGGPDSGMGLGWRVTRANGRRLICHGGDGGGYTAFAGGYPEEKLGLVLLMNTGDALAARPMIANGVLALIAGTAGTAPAPAEIGRFSGRYRSAFWDIVADIAHDGDGPSATIRVGWTNPYRDEISHLAVGSDGALTGCEGMFHGFEVTFQEDESAVRFSGGVYPWVFIRESEQVPIPEATDQEAVLTGIWQGTVQTPIGGLAATLRIQGPTATVSTPFGRDVDVEAFRAARGLVEGESVLDLPGYGKVRMFLRLRALPRGRLAGLVFARGLSMEVAMPVELGRE